MTFGQNYGVSQFAVICITITTTDAIILMKNVVVRIYGEKDFFTLVSNSLHHIAMDIIIKERENIASQSLSSTSSVLIITRANVVGWFHREKVVLPRGTWNGRAGLLH